MQASLANRQSNSALPTSAEKHIPQLLVQSLYQNIKSRDPETAAHTLRVSALAGHIASSLGIVGTQFEEIRAGALLHDLGKIATPDTILLKQGPLTEFERTIINRHPMDGFRSLGKLQSFQDLTSAVLLHHERLDGSGYPFGLKGDQIPLSAQICMVADMYDALTSKRSYKPPLTSEAALEILSNEAARGRLNSQVVTTLVELVGHPQRRAA